MHRWSYDQFALECHAWMQHLASCKTNAHVCREFSEWVSRDEGITIQHGYLSRRYAETGLEANIVYSVAHGCPALLLRCQDMHELSAALSAHHVEHSFEHHPHTDEVFLCVHACMTREWMSVFLHDVNAHVRGCLLLSWWSVICAQTPLPERVSPSVFSQAYSELMAQQQ